MVVVKGGELIIGHHRPPWAHLSKPLHPVFAILAVQTSGLPDEEKPVGWEDRAGTPEKFLLCAPPKMVKRLTDPYDMDRFVPRLDGFDKILAPQINWAGEAIQLLPGDFQRRS